MKAVSRVLLRTLVALTMVPVSGAVAQTAQEKERILAVLAQLRAGEKIEVPTTQRALGSAENVEANLGEARAMARACQLSEDSIVETITGTSGVSAIAVTLECAESKRYGLMFTFKRGDLSEISLRPGGFIFAPPPPPLEYIVKQRGRITTELLKAGLAGDATRFSEVLLPNAKLFFGDPVKKTQFTVDLLKKLIENCNYDGKMEGDEESVTVKMICNASERRTLTLYFVNYRVASASTSNLIIPAGRGEPNG